MHYGWAKRNVAASGQKKNCQMKQKNGGRKENVHGNTRATILANASQIRARETVAYVHEYVEHLVHNVFEKERDGRERKHFVDRFRGIQKEEGKNVGNVWAIRRAYTQCNTPYLNSVFANSIALMWMQLGFTFLGSNVNAAARLSRANEQTKAGRRFRCDWSAL